MVRAIAPLCFSPPLSFSPLSPTWVSYPGRGTDRENTDKCHSRHTLTMHLGATVCFRKCRCACQNASANVVGKYKTPMLTLKTTTLTSISQLQVKYSQNWASWGAQWVRVLYCSASCATRDSGGTAAPRLCRNRLRPGGPWGDAQLT